MRWSDATLAREVCRGLLPDELEELTCSVVRAKHDCTTSLAADKLPIIALCAAYVQEILAFSVAACVSVVMS
jgi:hypothetical protein